MRIKLLLFMFFSFTMSLVAKEKEVKINTELQQGIGRHAKGIFPEVSHDDAILYIYSSRPINGINIQVKNVETGNVVYENSACISAGEKRPFMMNIGNGQYEINMTIGDKCFVGYFEI